MDETKGVVRMKAPVQSLIDHIKTAVDVDPWAKEETERICKLQIPTAAEIEGGGVTWYYACGRCHGAINHKDRFCRHCGGAIGWG